MIMITITVTVTVTIMIIILIMMMMIVIVIMITIMIMIMIEIMIMIIRMIMIMTMTITIMIMIEIIMIMIVIVIMITIMIIVTIVIMKMIKIDHGQTNYFIVNVLVVNDFSPISIFLFHSFPHRNIPKLLRALEPVLDDAEKLQILHYLSDLLPANEQEPFDRAAALLIAKYMESKFSL